jgi:hypothetical protein
MFILGFFYTGVAVLINFANINSYLGHDKFCQTLHTFPANDKISFRNCSLVDVCTFYDFSKYIFLGIKSHLIRSA